MNNMDLGSEVMQVIPIICIVAAVGIFVGTRIYIMMRR